MADDATAPHRNRLAAETSPYLLQHAHNPVDWYPWGPQALERARREDKPILLSIGYSACHWCHVMAHESFEDPHTAEVMNRLFVNIKVDREERPDLDAIYQTAHQLLTRRGGGWPLTVFLTPDQTPFVAGTYFPREPRYGLPAFTDILERIAGYWASHRDQVLEQNGALRTALAQIRPDPGGAPGMLDPLPLKRAREQLRASFDERWGGFGGAPKFPHPGNLNLLLRCAATGDSDARRMAVQSLRAMCEGGLFDHLGGGFFRYTVDERWEIPHFEKMLYDNGPLLTLVVDAWQLTGDEFFRDVALRTGEWVLREMQAPEGGYYATLDADSDGHEGGFYVWDREQIRALLAPAEMALAGDHFGLGDGANFEGRWHLRICRPPQALAHSHGLDAAEVQRRLAAARERLLAARAQRPRPGRDEKILTGWNALMIKGMASAGRRLGEPRFIASALRALDFVKDHLLHEARLLASWKDGRAHLNAYLDDYAFLIDAILELLQVRWRDGDVSLALSLAETLTEHFEDEAHGGFFFTADDHEPLIHRPKPFDDGSTPSGNGVAAYALHRLSLLTGDLNLRDAAERTVRAGWEGMVAHPAAHGSLLLALRELLEPPETVVLRGGDDELAPWLAQVTPGFLPHRMVLAIPPQARDLPGLLGRHHPAAAPVAYVCGAHHCSPPIHGLPALRTRLQEVAPCA